MILRSLLIVATPYAWHASSQRDTTHSFHICTCHSAFITWRASFIRYTRCTTAQQRYMAGLNSRVRYDMGWLRLVGSLQSQFSFAKEPYKRDLYSATTIHGWSTFACPVCNDSYQREEHIFFVHRSLFDYTGLFWHGCNACPVCSDSRQQKNHCFFVHWSLFDYAGLFWHICGAWPKVTCQVWYGMATISRLPKNMGLFW